MPLAIMDGTHVTAYRTGAAGAVAASVLAQKGSRSVGIVGTGTQGRMQLIALKELFHIQQAKVWNINRSSAEEYRDQMSKMLSIDIEVVDTPGAVVPDVDILVTATPSKKALINEDVIHEGLHINAIGADGPGKQELDPKIMTRVSKIVVDSFEQCRKIGEIQHALRLGLINDSSIHAEIGEIINGNKSGRETESEVTIFDSTGLSAQDIAAAKIVFETARKKRLGKRVNLFG